MFKLCVASMSLTMRDEDVRSFDQYANYAKGALTLATERLVKYEFKVSCETAPKGQGFFAENP